MGGGQIDEFVYYFRTLPTMLSPLIRGTSGDIVLPFFLPPGNNEGASVAGKMLPSGT
ncbi:hypothetical protein HMPREF0290_2784 [Corynebacterium efficiens YS-314]|uniref:Uncharacterized protein n=1 Tax=Corynebacterium efficiens (strain DSM 44549 / YS-314 / AJ 12310 / JCM 11189 / NBRC 100395) TaxID=196164 RepID=Q8FSZ6_COREF|nr:hypothetical protein HMPREF0290_2784 [Corynebacterium efficiens YS-314]BAC19706.1 hypothetical protein [Corynebacterium efficiens YS-314]